MLEKLKNGLFQIIHHAKMMLKSSLFSWSNQRFSDEEIVTIILGKYENEVLCTPPTINVSHNVAFLVNTGKLRKPNDLKCDDIINSLANQSC